jgi:hypothetical protein
MIWVIMIVCLAGIAASPTLYAGWWATKRWFRVCVYVSLFFVVTMMLRTH